MDIKYLNPQSISVGARKRVVDPSAVAIIKKAIQDTASGGEGFDGLINPITVTMLSSGQPDLICGMHRLLAVKELRWEAIPCHVLLTLEDKQQKLLEIVENYCTAGLSPADRGAHAVEYAELESWRVGQEGRPKKPASDAGFPEISSAVKKLAEKTGRSPRTVREDLQIGTTVDGEVLRQVHGTKIDNRRELLALGKFPKTQQRKIAKAWADPSVKKRQKPTTILGQQKREKRETDLAEKINLVSEKLGSKLYGMLLTDPPWSREVYSEAGKSRDPANHYPTMTESQLHEFKLPAAEDCVLFMWSTQEHLSQAMRLIDAWGFTYKSGAVWYKPKAGTGYWFRTQHELVLVAAKGHPVAPAPGTQISSVFEAPVGKHSAKPPIIHELIERMWPTTPRAEVFAREVRPGWDAIGAEVPIDEAAE